MVERRNGTEQMKLVIFDFDMTLFDTLECMRDAYVYAFAHIGVDVHGHDDVERWIGEPMSVTFARLGCDESRYADFEDTFIERADSMSLSLSHPFPETRNVVLSLIRSGSCCAIVTSEPRHIVCGLLRKYDMFDVFGDSRIIGFGEYGDEKPSPEPILTCMSRFPYILRGETTYVGDSHNDMIAADAAGVTGVLIDRQNIGASNRHRTISSLSELLF